MNENSNIESFHPTNEIRIHLRPDNSGNSKTIKTDYFAEQIKHIAKQIVESLKSEKREESEEIVTGIRWGKKEILEMMIERVMKIEV